MVFGHNTSCQILIIHNSIQYTRRRYLKDRYLAIIIYEIKLNRTSKSYLIGHYRQWQLPRELQSNALNYNSQEYKYSKTIDIFNKILKEND